LVREVRVPMLVGIEPVRLFEPSARFVRDEEKDVGMDPTSKLLKRTRRIRLDS